MYMALSFGTLFFNLFNYCLAYRTGQSMDLTVIGNPVFTLLRDLVFPLSRDQRN